ncbi:forkhead-associated protein [Gordonia terrae C-6]|uniref:Forkhead-associated protein n=1 Tax=Gordonia terrae C-6 TaxID=1316928 RepID=R7Y4J0_9ACTN|nr:FHA domain-containing protein [Gordonia terrae]EON30968.1 forkhead-associated protein [Gordonia terrae C-6]
MTIPGDIPSVTPTVTLIPGAGVVIRTPAFLCLMADTVPTSFTTDLLDIESAVSVPDSMPRRGRHLVRALAQLVATADEPVDIAFAAPDSAGIAIFLSGRVYGETDGKRMEPAAGDTYDRAVPWPYEGLGLYLAGTEPAEVGEERFDLVEGMVPAAGALLHTPLGLRGTEFHAVPQRSAPQRPAQPGPDRVVEPSRPDPDPGPPTEALGDLDDPEDEKPQPPVSELPAPEPPAPEPPAPEPIRKRSPFDDLPPRPASPDLDVEPVGDHRSATPEPDPMGTTERMAPGAGLPASDPLPFTSTPLGGPFEREPLSPPGPRQPEPAPRDATPPGGRPHIEPAPAPNPFAEPLEPRAPLPKEEHQKPATEVVKIEASRAMVHGIRCSRGHLNHPQSWLCGVCGIRMDQLTTFLVEGERPPLGWLLLDNGFTFLLDEDLVIGREPGSAGGGPAGSPKPIRVQDETGQLSRRHVEIRLVEWTVQLVDLGSANGTFVADPSNGNRETRLLPHRAHVLVPGSHVRIGGRHFIFESHHARI